MRQIRLILLSIVLAGAAILPNLYRTNAAGAAIGQYYAGCGNFSIDVAVSGNHDDGGGLDKFRYLITDGNGKVLYQEDDTRPINTTAGSTVVNMPYSNPGVTKNPVVFAVVDLDSNGNSLGNVAATSYDAPCQPVSGKATAFGNYYPAKINLGVMIATTPVYQTPGGQTVPNITEVPGAKWQTIYRSADANWIAIYVGGNNLIWVPASTIAVNPSLLPIAPTHIDGSSLYVTSSSPAVPTGATVRTTDYVRLHSAPSFSSPTLTIVPIYAPVSVIGRTANSNYLKVIYGTYTGWIATFYTSGANLNSLPVVQ